MSSRVENGYQPNSVSFACHVQINSIYKSMSISVYIYEGSMSNLFIGLVFQIKWIVSLSA